METALLRRFTRSRLASTTCPCLLRSTFLPFNKTSFRSLRHVTPPQLISRSSYSTAPAPITQLPTTPHPRKRPLIALGIETSCDDTCAAVVTSDRRILSEVLRTQHHLHEPMGGIVPKLAHHAHMRNLPSVVQEAIQSAGLGEQGIQAIDVIAVTRGPGLAHCLGVGLNAAKTLAAALNKPLIGVHHMEAHALTARLTTRDPDLPIQDASSSEPRLAIGSDPYPSFPFLTLLVSGGHTMLLVAHSVDRYTTLATTLDDSIGEAFDKTARELDISWLPGRAGGPGASLEEFAKGSTNPGRYLDRLPIPLSLRAGKNEMKFSFAGLKTAVTRIVNQEKASSPIGEMDENRRQDLAAGFQNCAVTHLCQKVEQALVHCHGQGMDISSLVISGGVGRNATLRSRMDEICSRFEHGGAIATDKMSSKEKKRLKRGSSLDAAAASKQTIRAVHPVRVICPPPKLCTDNAVMIAWTGLERYQLGLIDPYDIDIAPKWPLDMLGTGIVPE
ncbi:MAG: glycoprotease family-domain-containing protein [Linnemannia gamsii]|nr:MAG: glycoprotease family-domain-containing protein [Linnemannia gamsii]